MWIWIWLLLAVINKVCMLNLFFLPEFLHLLCIMHVITLHTFIYSFIKRQHDFLVTWPKGLCLHNTENWQGTQWYKLPAEQEYLLSFCGQVLSGSLLLGSPNTDTDSGSITSHCKTPCFSLFSQGGAKTRHSRVAKIKLITDPSSN